MKGNKVYVVVHIFLGDANERPVTLCFQDRNEAISYVGNEVKNTYEDDEVFTVDESNLSWNFNDDYWEISEQIIQ